MSISSSANPSVGDGPINAIMVVAIDFGTTFSGYAFSFKSNKKDIRMYSSWGTCVGIPVSFKAPTCVLTDKNDRFVSFGYEAQNKYSTMTPEEAEDFHFYEKFKMTLHNKNLSRTITIKSNAGHGCCALNIFSMVLKFLKDHVLSTIKTQTGSTPPSDSVQWVVTVPAIWSDGSKQFMREAAHKGELIPHLTSHQLMIALEPEAASLYCRQLDLPLSPYSESGEDVKMKVGTKYLVLDCGGGTLDVTAHELKAGGKISELYHANGGSLGGTQVDEKFIQLLQKIFGAHVIKNFRSENPADWLQLMVNFERVKRSLNPKEKGQSVNLPVSFEFASCYQSLTGKSIRNAVSPDFKQKGVSFASGMLRLPYAVMEELFKPVVSGIVAHVKDLLQKAILKQVTYVLLVGGFGESQVLQDALKSSLSYRSKLLVPSEASQCVLKGAVLFGHMPSDIAERIIRKTYGVDVTENYDPESHSDPNKTVERDGVKKAYPVFHKFVTKGDKIRTGGQRSFTLNPSTASQQSCTNNIYQTDDENPKYTDEYGVDEIGKVSIQLPGEGRDRVIEYSITFGSTELEVEARDPRPGGDKKSCTVDFLSH